MKHDKLWKQVNENKIELKKMKNVKLSRIKKKIQLATQQLGNCCSGHRFSVRWWKREK